MRYLTLTAFLFSLCLLFAPLSLHAITAADEAFTAARQLLDTGNDEQAIISFRKFLKDYPDDERILQTTILIGYGLKNLQQYPAAITEFTRVVDKAIAAEQASLRAEAFFQRAECKAIQGQYDLAVADYQACIKIPAPANKLILEANYWLADSLKQLGRDQEAQKAFDQVVTLDKEHPLAVWSVFYSALLKFNAKQYDAAINDFQLLIKNHADSDAANSAKVQLAFALAGKARTQTEEAARAATFSEAEKAFIVVEQDQKNTAAVRRQVQLALAQMYLDIKQPAKAEAAYQRALQGLPADSEDAANIILQRGHLFYNSARYTEAASEYQRLSQQNTFPAIAKEALYWQGNARYLLARQTPGNTADYQASIELLQRYLKLLPLDEKRAPRALLLIALSQEAQAQAGNAASREAALLSYQQLSLLWPQSQEATEVLPAVSRLTDGMDEAVLVRIASTDVKGEIADVISWQLARKQFLNERYQESQNTLLKLLKGKLNKALQAQANALLAATYLQMERFKEALAAYQTALTQATTDEQRALITQGLAQSYLGLNDYTNAIEQAVKWQQFPISTSVTISAEDQQAERWELLAQCYIAAKRYDDAQKAYQSLLTAAPKYPRQAEIYLLRGWLAEQQDQPQAAIDFYKIVIDKYTDAVLLQDAKLRVAALLLKQKNYQQAITTLRTIPDNSPQKDFVTYLLGLAYDGAGDKLQSSQTFRELADKFPDSKYAGEALFRAGEYYSTTGDYQQAIGLLQRATRILTDDNVLKPNAIYLTGTSALDINDYPTAVTAFTELMTKYPDNVLIADALFWKAQALEAQGKASALDARTAYQLYGKSYPTGQYVLDAQVGMVRSAILAANVRDIRVELQQAIQMSKDQKSPALLERAKNLLPEIYFYLGNSYASEKKYQEALQAYATIAGYNLEPWYSLSLLEMARCNAEQGEIAAAQRTLRLLVQKFPQSKAAKAVAELAAHYQITLE